MKTLKNIFTSTIIHKPLYIVMFFILLLAACSQTDSEHNDSLWTCPMHPEIISDKPGVCPICNMELIKKVSDEESEVDDETDMEGTISLSDKKQILANVSTIKVEKENLNKELTAYSYLDFAEQNRKTISAKFNGRLEKLFVSKTGDYIKKDQPLFEIYSPDLVQVQNEYLTAFSLSETANNFSMLKAAEMKLRIFGLTDNQINELKRNKEVKITLTYYSPVSGTVIEKKVQEGDYVNEGSVIYDVAELSMLWNVAEIYENDLSQIKLGRTAKLKLRAYPGEEFKGKITFIYPVVNEQTRTVKVRSEFSNNGGKLKPQMYGETIFESGVNKGILVPSDAIIFAGKRSVVWVKISKGKFEARDVKVGSKYGNNYHIISGINEGEEIAATGGFLIDSESQLKSGVQSGHQHGSESEPDDNTDHSEHEVQTATKEKSNTKTAGKNSDSKNSIVHEGVVDVNMIDKNKDGKVFQDPMDWNVISDEPGKCPLCNMKLAEVTIAEAKENLINNGFKIK